MLAPLAGELDAGGLEQLATTAYMLGRDDEFVAALEGAVRAHEGSDRAARCAFWIGLSLALRGEPARAGGWFARAGRLVERHGSDCVERGYLLLPLVIERQIAGDRARCGGRRRGGDRDRRAVRGRRPARTRAA